MTGGMPGSLEGDHDALLASFMGLHDVDMADAARWLAAGNWNLEAATLAYENHLHGDGSADGDESGDGDSDTETTADRRGGRTLDGNPAPQPAQTRSGGTQKSSASGKKIATLGDLGSGQAPHDHDDDSGDDHDLFAGGEKSGLAVQNPDDLKRKIIEKARRTGARAAENETQPGPSNFSGTARTLGGDDAPSRVIEDPTANAARPLPRVERHLHFWSNGFSVDDGDLYDTSDPQNAQILQMIRSGRAPVDIMNVGRDQEVEVKVEQHDGPYVAPKKKLNPFSGAGQRLGSPTPGITTSAPSMPLPAASAPASASTSASVDVDASQPTVNIQIRLGDGTRLVSRFNASHTINDIYEFVDASSPSSAAQPYVLMTTFPSKELNDRSTKIGDMAELKKGGAVVQKRL